MINTKELNTCDNVFDSFDVLFYLLFCVCFVCLNRSSLWYNMILTISYCVPIEKVLFDGNDTMLSSDKPKYVLNQVLHRLYDYSVSDIRYMSDHENPVIRLKDDDTMQEDYFVCKEEITWEML